MHYMAPNMSPVQVMLMWQVLDENSRGFICEFLFMICIEIIHMQVKDCVKFII